jgi:hypothetical protein
MEALVDGLRSLITHPFSSIPIRVRRQTAHINIRGTFRLLLHDAATLANSTHPLTELQWRMFQFFVHWLHKTALTYDCVGSVRKTLEILKLTEFFDFNATPIPGWDHEDFQDLLEEDSDDDEEEDIDYDDLPDDLFEPSGPERKVEHRATAVATNSELRKEYCSICRDTLDIYAKMREEVPVKVECGHCFHYGCLNTLINGISKYSNACPNCRQTVCPPQEKRLKDEYTLSQPATPNDGVSGAASESALEASDPRDKEGDVVMTDD